MDFEFDIDCPLGGDGTPRVATSLRRINVIMGANGTGKSKLLYWLARNSSAIFGDLKPTYIEDGRIINIPVDAQVNTQTYPIFNDPNAYLEDYLNSRIGNLHGRILNLVSLLRELERQQKVEHSDLVAQWEKAGADGKPPSREIPPLERLISIFNQVFPDLRLVLTATPQLYCERAGGSQPFGVNQLSQGEKQAFVIIADLLLLSRPRNVFLIDEPEINLHATLADRLWSLLEETFPQSVFVYATHSLTFAARSSIQRAIILRPGPTSAVAVDRILGNTEGDLEPFLGPLPGVLAYQKCLFTEGTAASVDRVFYSGLMNDPRLGVVPGGSSSDILSAMKREGVWRAVAPDANVLGVIDRDFKTESEIEAAEAAGCLVLDLHEIEAFLCDPHLLEDLHSALGTASSPITASAVQQRLIHYARRTILRVSAQRMFRRVGFKENFSLGRKILSEIKDYEVLSEAVLKQAQHIQREKSHVLREIEIKAALRREFDRCNTAIESGDVTQILRLFEAKEFLLSIIPDLGLTSSTALANAVFAHLEVDKYENIGKLRNRLQLRLCASIPER